MRISIGEQYLESFESDQLEMDLKALGLTEEDLLEIDLKFEDLDMGDAQDDAGVDEKNLEQMRELSKAMETNEIESGLLEELEAISSPKEMKETIISQIKSKAIEAVQLKQSGDHKGALQAMREYKQLSSSHLAQSSGPSKDDLRIVIERYNEYARKALDLRKLGRPDLAKQVVLEIRKIKQIRERVELGGKIGAIPAPIGRRKEFSHDAEPSMPEKSWDSLLMLLEKQIEEASTPTQKKEAMILKKKVLKAQERDYPLPVYHVEQIEEKKKAVYPEIPEEHIQISVLSSIDLIPPSGMKSFFIEVEFSYGKDDYTNARSGSFSGMGSLPINWSVVIPIKSKRIGRGFKFSKVQVRLLCPQMLFSPKLLGSGDFRIGDLLDNAVVEGEVILRREKHLKGKLKMSVKCRNPLQSPNGVIVSKKLVIIENFLRRKSNFPEEKPNLTQESRTDISSYQDPNSLEMFVSNDVLQDEIDSLGHMIAVKKTKREEIPESLQKRYDQATFCIMMLEQSVSEGKLSLEEYLERLRASIAFHRELALDLKSKGNIVDAKRVLRRFKLMQKELAAAEESL